MSTGFWKTTAKLFLRSKSGVTGLVIVGLLLFTAMFAPLLAGEVPLLLADRHGVSFPVVGTPERYAQVDWQLLRAYNKLPAWQREGVPQVIRPETVTALFPLVPHDPARVEMGRLLQTPSAAHPCGTDNLGRDILSRIIHGTRIAVAVGIVAMGIAAVIGMILGSLAGYYGGKTDMAVSRFIEVVICFPVLFLILAVLAFLPPSIINIMIVIGITGWTGIARLIRAEILKVKQMEYVSAARALGYSNRRILLRHILPNAVAPVFVSISFGIAGSILTETALSFLGFGVQPPTASWGQVLSLAREFPSYPHLAIFPGLAIFAAVTGYNLVGEALRDALDPRLRLR